MFCRACRIDVRVAAGDSNTCPKCGAPLETSDVERTFAQPSATRPATDEELEATIVSASAGATPPTTIIGQTLGGCSIEARIGGGAMGTVYKATQTSLGRTVALKTIKPELCDEEQFLERFQSEARTIGQFKTPHVVQIYDAGLDQGIHFMVMEYVAGGDLEQFAAQQPAGKVAAEDALRLLHEACLGLQKAEACGTVHRDIKPENLLLDEEGTLKVADFGIAKSQLQQIEMTATGISPGTLMYMSPEQAAGEKLDSRSDMWSLGASFYHVMTGQKPAERATTIMELIAKKSNTDFLSPVRALPDQASSGCFVQLSRVVEKMTALRREDRYEAFAPLLADLERIRAGRAPRAAAPPRSGARRRRRSIVLAAVAALALGAWGGAQLLRQDPPKTRPSSVDLLAADYTSDAAAELGLEDGEDVTVPGSEVAEAAKTEGSEPTASSETDAADVGRALETLKVELLVAIRSESPPTREAWSGWDARLVELMREPHGVLAAERVRAMLKDLDAACSAAEALRAAAADDYRELQRQVNQLPSGLSCRKDLQERLATKLRGWRAACDQQLAAAYAPELTAGDLAAFSAAVGAFQEVLADCERMSEALEHGKIAAAIASKRRALAAAELALTCLQASRAEDSGDFLSRAVQTQERINASSADDPRFRMRYQADLLGAVRADFSTALRGQGLLPWADWDAVRYDVKGVVELPTGVFPRRAKDRLRQCWMILVQAPAGWCYLDQTEVTWGQWARFQAKGGAAIELPKDPEQRVSTAANYPLYNVTPEAVDGFLAWSGARLPTSAEWAYVASFAPATDGAFTRGNFGGGAQVPADPWKTTAPAIAQDANDLVYLSNERDPVLAFHRLAGNVAELVTEDGARLRRGGDYTCTRRRHLQVANEVAWRPSAASGGCNDGFRCARSL